MKYTILVIWLSSYIQVFSQQLSNPSFEQWDTIGPYSQPTDWFTVNELILEEVAQSVVLTADAQHGDFAVELKTVPTPFGANIAGILATGVLLDNSYNISFDYIKIPYPYRPQTWEFYYKFSPANKDTAIALFVLTKWNTLLKKTDTIALSGSIITDSVTNYTLLSLPFNYATGATPDSAFVLISPNLKNNPPLGTSLFIDNLNVKGNVTSVSKMLKPELPQFSLYPNPANNNISIGSTNSINWICIRGLSGKELLRVKNSPEINTHALENGMYILEVSFSNQLIQSRKFIISHP